MSSNPTPTRIYSNGINLATGAYAAPPTTLDALFARALNDLKHTPVPPPPVLADQTGELGFKQEPVRSPQEWKWGVVVHADETPAVMEQVRRFSAYRSGQLGMDAKTLVYQDGMSARDFLAAYGVQPGEGDTDKVPYYLALIGGPEKIPFEIQFLLGTEYGVGRIDLADAAAYAAYFDHLIAYEHPDAAPASDRDAIFWGTANEGDEPSRLAAQYLVKPLYDDFDRRLAFTPAWVPPAGATRASLQALFARPQPPALLFTASHGAVLDRAGAADTALLARQRKFNGALVTQDWDPGSHLGPTAGQLFAGSDLTAQNSLRGMVHFAFACYGAGTPERDDYRIAQGNLTPMLAAESFTADLARREMELGALGFIGHVERVHGYSFVADDAAPDVGGFQRAIGRLLAGAPLGQALRDQLDFALQTSNYLLELIKTTADFDDTAKKKIAALWMERNDARAFVLLGDPAAQIRLK